jgi:NAD(P)-dependent dehydrogenase (short-subunit alcohol dehydrogenase family)
MELQDSTALISGGASGLGAATAGAFVRRGARVVLFDLDERGSEVASRLGDRTRFVAGDVTSEDDVRRAIAAVEELGGRLDVAVCCAGIGGGGRALRRDGPMPLDVFTRVVTVNLIGTFNVQRLAAEAMTREPRLGDDPDQGVIIATASIAAFEGRIGQPAYAASKGGVVSLTLPLARELAARRIRVATVAPGIFDTPLLGRLSDEVRAELAASVPHPKRIGDPADFARLVVHIVENPMINGEVLRLDGALRMAP